MACEMRVLHNAVKMAPKEWTWQTIVYQIASRPNTRALKVKVKLSLCFNGAPLREGILGEWRHIIGLQMGHVEIWNCISPYANSTVSETSAFALKFQDFI
jgi:hypothetical protein